MSKPKIIAVISSKGGAGRSMIARNLAAALAASGKATLLLDTSNNKTSLTWADWREKHKNPGTPLKVSAVLDYTNKRTHDYKHEGWKNALASAGHVFVAKDLPRPKDFPDAPRFERIVIDTDADNNDTSYAAWCAHLILVPVRPSMDDLISLKETYRTRNVEERGFVLFNQVMRKSEYIEGVEVLGGLNYRCVNVPIMARPEYQRAAQKGKGVIDTRQSAAQQEIVGLKEWVEDTLSRLPPPDQRWFEEWLFGTGWWLTNEKRFEGKPVPLRKPKQPQERAA